MATAQAMEGILSPCMVVVGESSAPVAVNRILFQRPSRIPFSRYPHSTVAAQPQPEPPAWTSCYFRSKIRRPQSVCRWAMSTPSAAKKSHRISLPMAPRSPVTMRS